MTVRASSSEGAQQPRRLAIGRIERRRPPELRARVRETPRGDEELAGGERDGRILRVEPLGRGELRERTLQIAELDQDPGCEASRARLAGRDLLGAREGRARPPLVAEPVQRERAVQVRGQYQGAVRSTTSSRSSAPRWSPRALYSMARLLFTTGSSGAWSSSVS